MWSSSPAEKKVWDDFSKYVEQQLGVESAVTLTPSNGYPTKLDLQLVSGTAAEVHGAVAGRGCRADQCRQ